VPIWLLAGPLTVAKAAKGANVITAANRSFLIFALLAAA
jgi:hypothetical protein